MTDEEILVCLTEILARLLGEPGLTLSPEEGLRGLPGWNDFVELSFLTVAENRFGVAFPPEATARVQTVGEFVDLVAERQGRND